MVYGRVRNRSQLGLPGRRKPRGSGGCETATGVMEAATRRKGVCGLRWVNVVITLIRGWIWTDFTLFPSGSSIRMGVSSNAKSYKV
eukprot:686678-Prymnesium_polylepis.1